MPCPEKFSESLEVFGVEEAIKKTIFDGYEGIFSKAKKAEKAAFFKRAIDIMDKELPLELTRDILAWNACCKSGARERASKEFARINAGRTIEEKLAKIGRAPYMNMGRPELDGEGYLIIHAVSYILDGRYECGCSNFNRVKRNYSVSRHYCFCCGGHFKYHYEIMLGLKLKLLDVVSSPLDTEGREPCVFRFEIVK